MSQAPHMPLFVDAYLADTGHLSTEEHGAYILLLMAMWRRGGTVPDDDRDNARILGLSRHKWSVIKVRLRPFLTFSDEGITQKRLKKEWDYVADKREKLRENGRKGGRPTINDDSDLAKAKGSENEKPTESKRKAPIPTPIPIGEEEALRACRKPARRLSYSQAFDEFWSAYPTDSLMSKKDANAQWSKLTPEDRVACMKAVPGFVAYCRDNPEYRPVHACRFISQRRFEGFADGTITPLRPAAKSSDDDWMDRMFAGAR